MMRRHRSRSNSSVRRGRDETQSGTRLTLDLWHPNCWAIEATNRSGGGVPAHAIYNSPKTDGDAPNSVNGLFTAFGDTTEEVKALLDAIRESDRAGSLLELRERFGRPRDAPGSVVSEFFLAYDPADMSCPTLLEHGSSTALRSVSSTDARSGRCFSSASAQKSRARLTPSGRTPAQR